MVVSVVTFRLPRPWTVPQAAAVFASTAPKYLGKPGLVRKHYHAPPDILCAEVPVSVENLTGVIVSS